MTVKGHLVMPEDVAYIWDKVHPFLDRVQEHTEGELNSETNTLTDPTDSSGELERQYSNVFGRNVSYVNAIDTLIMNQMPDFRIDDFIGDPDEDLTDTYEDLMKLRKSLIIDPDVKVDVVANIKAVEDVLTDEVKEDKQQMLF